MTTSTAPMSAADRRRADREHGLIFVAAMAGLMWLAEILDTILGGDLDQYGIEPHDGDGLVGIATAPFLHAGFGHLIGNTIPFVILGAAIALSGLARIVWATVIIAVIAGLGTWLVAPSGTEHIGASGVVFGYATYLITRAVFSRSLAHLLVGGVVLAVYGSTLLFGLVPQDGISWQGHLFGGIGGIVAAWALEARRSEARPAAVR
jgi:membrane associated rhomboid family serine protease